LAVLEVPLDRLPECFVETLGVSIRPARLLQLGEVVPEGLPLELVRAVVAPRDGMTRRLGELTTTLRVSLLDLMPGSRSGLAPGPV
jgi:hypothetical protein